MAILRCFAFALFLFSACQHAQAVKYRLEPLGANEVGLPNDTVYASYGYGISSHGSAVGSTQSTPYIDDRPFLHDGDVARWLPGFGYAFDVNSSDHVVGVARRGYDNRAFFYDGSTMRDLGTFGGTRSEAHAISDNGFITGGADLPFDGSSGRRHVFLYDGEMHDMGTLGGTSATGADVNSRGQITGASTLAGIFPPVTHAFLHDGVSMKDLGTLGGADSMGIALNDLGHVVGVSQVLGEPVNFWHAFF